MKEESVCTIYGVEWLSLISSSLSPPFLPSAITGWQRLAQHWICLKTTKVAFIQSNLLCQPKLITIFGKEEMQGTTLSFPLVLESYQSPLLPLASVLHQMMSPCENFLFYWRPIGRLLDWVESLPTHKGSDSSESPNGWGEKILIESSTVLNSEKDFSKFDQIDRESHHLLGGPTDRPSWAGRPCHRTFI